jgi:hypothetical protein
VFNIKTLKNIICESITIVHFNKYTNIYLNKCIQKINLKKPVYPTLEYSNIVLSEFIHHLDIRKTVYPFQIDKFEGILHVWSQEFIFSFSRKLKKLTFIIIQRKYSVLFKFFLNCINKKVISKQSFYNWSIYPPTNYNKPHN